MPARNSDCRRLCLRSWPGLGGHPGSRRSAGRLSGRSQKAAEQAAAEPQLPDLDRTDLELITIDPAGSRDLDQALHIARGPSGEFVVSYAIADIAAFVRSGDPSILRHIAAGPPSMRPTVALRCIQQVLSEGAASLLPNEVRPALFWTIKLDHRGEMVVGGGGSSQGSQSGSAELPRGAGRDRRQQASRDSGAAQAGRPVA